MTLLAIAISSTVLIGFASFSLNHALESRMVEEELQRKWGAASLQRATLQQSSALLNPPQQENPGIDRNRHHSSMPVASQKTQIKLGDIDFEVWLEDESSKLDVNHVFALAKNEIAARRFIENHVELNTTVQLNPLANDKRRTLKEDAFECWEQVFDADSVSHPRQLRRATASLTCWSHQLNFRTASDEVLFDICSLVAGQAAGSQLVGVRQKEPNIRLAAALEQINISKSAARALQKSMSETSQSQSVWIHAADADTETHYLVIRESISGVQRFSTFQW